jgi:hypothetical protein
MGKNNCSCQGVFPGCVALRIRCWSQRLRTSAGDVRSVLRRMVVSDEARARQGGEPIEHQHSHSADALELGLRRNGHPLASQAGAPSALRTLGLCFDHKLMRMI